MPINVLQQRGAVLAFSLVMLLLLTLVGVSMIQQNKQELGMAGNARQQTQALATAEADMARAEAVIDGLRYTDKANHLCQPTSGENDPNQLDEGDELIAGVSTITGTYCLLDYLVAASGGDEQQCTYTNGERDDTSACDRLSNTGTGTGAGCSSEIYTLLTTVTDSQGSHRTLESKYAVNCRGNF
jgi:Tfp pilus assembly protein PilX